MNEKFYGNQIAGERSDDHGSYDGRGNNDCGCESRGRDAGRSGNATNKGDRGNHHGKTDRAKLLRKIQEYNFMMIEAALFLNNQPCCEAAQKDYCKYRELYLDAVKEYEECYGPLTINGVNVKRDGWSWINSPWPWEVEDC